MIIPLFRIFDEQKAREFYMDYLDFKLDWEHRFDDLAPLYMQVSWGDLRIHLTEHHGDCSPGAAIRVLLEDIEQYHAKLMQKNYRYARPGIEVAPWNTKELSVIDPFGNKIVFYEESDPV
ncbi:glyoxalase superfamily protein [Paenibacillus sp. JCM 10914]|uniref:glyoxalase superfamily protein n=1 Tax=Paenibacillus sp. JCM 10914 TaxID=1236974 RepID=UPI0003CC2BA2|nr:glyoxalase superfamily protein [Paenibacillus sp. JCM 10914]GAE05232.1 glyoxalase family protein [Paenibacillus sp. JCM 10914]